LLAWFIYLLCYIDFALVTWLLYNYEITIMKITLRRIKRAEDVTYW
jgi:hypothetical protein